VILDVSSHFTLHPLYSCFSLLAYYNQKLHLKKLATQINRVIFDNAFHTQPCGAQKNKRNNA